MSRTAASLLREALENVGVRYTFGIPGVHNTEIYDELAKSPGITPVLVTHEGGAAFMADAVSRSGTSLGTLVIVPAAGVTHAASGIAEAFLDGIPMLVIAGGIRRDTGRRYQLHDVDQHALLKPITKGRWLVERHADVIPTIYEAVRVAMSGEPGPVFVEIPVNLQLLTGDPGPVHEPPAPVVPEARASAVSIAEAARLLASARSPGLFVGWGAVDAGRELVELAERLGAPVSTTLQGLSAFPANHPLHAGFCLGRASVPAVESAFRDCDCMLAVGTRFGEIATGSYRVRTAGQPGARGHQPRSLRRELPGPRCTRGRRRRRAATPARGASRDFRLGGAQVRGGSANLRRQGGLPRRVAGARSAGPRESRAVLCRAPRKTRGRRDSGGRRRQPHIPRG